jgi:lipopolysaccharide/colanic/teichoic acid biosynthesis glycosyltransferase
MTRRSPKYPVWGTRGWEPEVSLDDGLTKTLAYFRATLVPEIVAGYDPWQHDRHLVRPGLTGWWQVSGRSDLPMHENTELDLFYVRRQSFLLDWRIALKTVRVVFKGLGAY